ncbi:MAG: putative viral replication protein [Cressdnaviricota sp.]|nr:MAG: putative viral replication protein [Cressdnaviricota sp.]
MDSSKIAPGKDGNTKSSLPSGNKKQHAERKHWILTVAWTDESKAPKSLELWLRRHCDRYIMQLEKGEDTGYLHLQLSISLKKKARLTWLKNHFMKEAHCEIIRNQEKAFDYCMKEDTRVRGPWIYPSPAQPIQDPMNNLEMKWWQRDILEKIKEKPDARTIYWYWDPDGGTGKTTFSKHLWLNHDVCFLQNAKKADMAYAYNGERIVVCNLPRTCEEFVSYDALESLKDGMIFSGKYESGAKVFDNPHVIVFANFEPDKYKLSLDRWNVLRL